MSKLIVAHGLAAGYNGAPAVEEISFTVERGEAVALLGPNGGGKTTLLRALLGELQPLSGTVELSGRAAYVPQTDRTRLDFPVSALDVTLMGTLARSAWWRPPGGRSRALARSALARLGLEQSAEAGFGSLSGGQRQRVLLARALVQDAPVLLLDEPLTGVDPASAERIDGLFGELRAEGHALLVATHDVESARRFDRVLCVNRKQIAFGPPSCLVRETLERTYGAELVVLEDDDGPVRAVMTEHHEH